MTVDVGLATFSAVQLVLASGAAAIAFGLRKTFEGGIFEKAWRVIAISPIAYSLAQAIELVQATQQKSPAFGVLASVFEVAFFIFLFSGFFMFSSAWGGNKGKEAATKPGQGGEAYANSAKGAMVFILGKTGAAKVMFYTGEPNMTDFESKLHGVLGNGGAQAVIRRMSEEQPEEAPPPAGNAQ